MLSTKQKTEILDALQAFNTVLKRHQNELRGWEQNVLSVTIAISACMLQEKILSRDTIDILQKAVDQIKHYSMAKSAAPLLSPAQLNRIVQKERAFLEKQLSILETIAEQGDEADVRALYSELLSKVEPDNSAAMERLNKVRNIMGWVT